MVLLIEPFETEFGSFSEKLTKSNGWLNLRRCGRARCEISWFLSGVGGFGVFGADRIVVLAVCLVAFGVLKRFDDCELDGSSY